MATEPERVPQTIHNDWEEVGGHLSVAMQEVSLELGGEELAERIAIEVATNQVLPNPNALKLLEELYPGSAEKVMTLSEEIQKITQERELAELKQPSLRKYGGALLRGLTSITFSGVQPRKN
ncbi:MAG TPA: hypothetical protein VFN31_03555 [Candidatus Saccharimonadales bacterium]|nr:hypothetical protein [Candidatus Saccharimonadales bacterium]